LLIGSHGYGVILNRLGVRASPFSTEDVDIARREALALENVPSGGLLEILRESGIDFVEVPKLERRAPSTSYKQRGRSQFHIDLLVPSPNETFPILEVPELKAHATGLPYLDYLLEESQTAALLGREGCCTIRVPVPERFAVHKLIVSRLRDERSAKPDKDVLQACVLAAALADAHSGAIAAAVQEVPRRAWRFLRPAVDAARRYLEAPHPRAWEELSVAAGGPR
jgi:hypothetical protein